MMVSNILKQLNNHVINKCKRRGLKLRCAGSGLWLIFLLPSALLCGVRSGNVSEMYFAVSIISIGQVINAVCGVLDADIFHSDDNVPFIQIGYIFSSTIVSLLLVFFTEQGAVYSLCSAVVTSISYHKIFEIMIRVCPRSFTYGEATVVTQSLILYLTSFITNNFLLFPRSVEQCEETATYILQAGYFAVLVVLMIASQCRKMIQRTLTFILTLTISFIAFVIFLPRLVIRKNSLLWLFQLMGNSASVTLIIFWVLCCSCAIFCLLKQTNELKPATSAIRKNFHFLMFSVLMPGLITCPCLMYVASGIAFALLIVTETCRKLQLTDYWEVLQLCFDKFKDMKDEGPLALTPLYLMVGCVAPLWIYPRPFLDSVPLPVLSGILSVAVGDAAASICGSKFGKHKWPGSLKTKEGTAGCFLSQILVLLFLSFTGVVRMRSLTWSSLVIAITSIVEARTDQIDNLVLPFIGYTLFMLFQ